MYELRNEKFFNKRCRGIFSNNTSTIDQSIFNSSRQHVCLHQILKMEDDEFSFNICAVQSSEKHDRVIVHIDIDCFYAQVEMILNPSLRYKPVGIKQKNIVVTCNYEARSLGVEKLMTVKCAMEKCPTLILVNGEDLKKYREMSEKIYQVLQSFSPFVEKLGLDENFIDITHKVNISAERKSKVCGHVYQVDDEDGYCPCGCTNRLREGSVIAQEMRNLLKSELEITSCAGVAHNKLMAKLAGAVHKPDQQTVLFPASTLRLMKSLKNPRNIPGVGSSTYKKLESLGISTIEELQTFDLTKLSEVLGAKIAKQIQQLSLGIDDSRVKITDRPKSIGAEDGFPTIRTEKDVRMKLKSLLKRVWDLVQKDGRLPTQVKLTVRKLHPESHSVRESRQTSLNLMTAGCSAFVGTLNENQEEKIISSLMNLFEKIVSVDVDWQVTLLGISFSNFPSGTCESAAKNSIQKYFTGPSRSNENTLPPPAKRCRFDESVLQELPPDIRQEVLEDMKRQLPSSSASQPSVNDFPCPSGVDPLVFRQLPVEIQKELLAGSKEKKETVTKKSNNLLQYFRKV